MLLCGIVWELAELTIHIIFIVARTFLKYRENTSDGWWSLSTESDSRKPESTMLVADREKWKPFSLVVELAGRDAWRSDGDRTVSYDAFFQKHHAIPQSWQIPSWNKTCFKRRATAVLIWLDCSSTAARHGTTWFQTPNLIQSNGTAVAENKLQ